MNANCDLPARNDEKAITASSFVSKLKLKDAAIFHRSEDFNSSK